MKCNPRAPFFSSYALAKRTRKSVFNLRFDLRGLAWTCTDFDRAVKFARKSMSAGFPPLGHSTQVDRVIYEFTSDKHRTYRFLGLA